ncbi:MAG: hypothetical protein K2N47_02705, partial [Clostridia bacterium]|nr:hypothetical protein [Clostridia bacterium]
TATAGLVKNVKADAVDWLMNVYTREVINVGEYKNDCVYMHENENGVSNYDIHYDYGDIKITVRKIIVEQLGAEWVYDGKVHSFYDEVNQIKTYTTYFVNQDNAGKWYIATYPSGEPISGLALPNDKLTATFYTEVLDVTPKGGVKNVVTYNVPNVKGEDFSNYEIVTSLSGKFNIKIGEDFVEKTFENGYSYGNLVILSQGITVYANDILGVIYGESYSYAIEAGNHKSTEDTKPEIAENHTLKITGVLYYKDLATANADVDNKLSITPKHVGEYVIKITDFIIYVKDDEEEKDISSNYIVTKKYGTLTIVAREIVVSAKDMSDSVYGDEVTTALYGYKTGNYKDNPAPDMQHTDALEISEIKYYDIAINGTRSGVNEKPKYAGDYYIGIESITIYDVVNGKKEIVGQYVFEGEYHYDGQRNLMTFKSNGGSTEDYIIEVYEGTLTINRRKITVYLKDVTVKYGESFDYPAATADEPNYKVGENISPDLVYDDTLTIGKVEHYAKVTDTLRGTKVDPKSVGTYFIAAIDDYTSINNVLNRSDYDITYVDGLLTIQKKE